MPEDRFAADWLALREPADHRARSAALVEALEPAWLAHGWARVLDLGSGTGSNLRWLAPRLPGIQAWTLVDHDAGLLARAAAVPGVRALRRLHGGLDAEGLAAVGDTDLVTASALLDLVSGAWLARLVEACAAAGCGALFALSYDGAVAWGRPDPDDALVFAAVNDHQRRDKGVGGALGPGATEAAEGLFQAAGYLTWRAPSPWLLGPADRALAVPLLEGWSSAAIAQRPSERARIEAWTDRRRSTLAESGWSLTVGHLDLLALPSGGAPSDGPGHDGPGGTSPA